MEALLASFGMVAIAEMGDKTQFATIARAPVTRASPWNFGLVQN